LADFRLTKLAAITERQIFFGGYIRWRIRCSGATEELMHDLIVQIGILCLYVGNLIHCLAHI